MTASMVVRRPDAGASTAQSPAQRPGEGDDGGVARHIVSSMHALFGSEVQWIFPAASSKLPFSFDERIGHPCP